MIHQDQDTPGHDASGDALPRLGISSCLLGEEVRFNGGHVRNQFLINALGPWVDWGMVFTEVGYGLGVPRYNLRLIGESSSPRLVMPGSGEDPTEGMSPWSRRRLEELRELDLDGFVLKTDSPSCGPFRVKVYDHNTVPSRTGRGLFAAELAEAMPLLPFEDEGRLNDPHLRENFVERIFAHRRWRELAADPSPGALVEFHRRHKLTLMAHSPQGQRQLGRLVAEAGAEEIGPLLERYGAELMRLLRQVVKRRGHTNVLHHVMGYLKRRLDADDKQELVELIEEYRLGRLPLIVPVTLLKHHLRREPVNDWITDQVYLNPYPSELMLRNHL